MVAVAGVMVVVKSVVVTGVDFETMYPVCSRGQIKTTIANPTSMKNKEKIPIRLAIIKQHFEGF